MQKVVQSSTKLFVAPSAIAGRHTGLVYPKMSMTIACDHSLPVAPAPATKKTRLEEGVLRVKRLSEHATLPTRGSALAAGYDLYRYRGLQVGCPQERANIKAVALKYLIRLGCQNQRLTVYTVSAITSICLLYSCFHYVPLQGFRGKPTALMGG